MKSCSTLSLRMRDSLYRFIWKGLIIANGCYVRQTCAIENPENIIGKWTGQVADELNRIIHIVHHEQGMADIDDLKRLSNLHQYALGNAIALISNDPEDDPLLLINEFTALAFGPLMGKPAACDPLPIYI